MGAENGQGKNGIFESTASFAKKEKVDRIWFGVDAKEDDSLGALPYGDYHIVELEGENNKGNRSRFHRPGRLP